MTNGLVVVLGRCGRNFAAGMTGGRAFVLDEQGDFGSKLCNQDAVDIDAVIEESDERLLRTLIERHALLTQSPRARFLLDTWADSLTSFVKVFPHELKRVLGIPRSPRTRRVEVVLPPASPAGEVQHG